MLLKLFIYLFPCFLSGENAIFEASGYVKKKYDFFFSKFILWKTLFLGTLFWISCLVFLKTPPKFRSSVSTSCNSCKYEIGKLWRPTGNKEEIAPCSLLVALVEGMAGQRNPRISFFMDIGKHTHIPYFLHGEAAINFPVILSLVLRI